MNYFLDTDHFKSAFPTLKPTLEKALGLNLKDSSARELLSRLYGFNTYSGFVKKLKEAPVKFGFYDPSALKNFSDLLYQKHKIDASETFVCLDDIFDYLRMGPSYYDLLEVYDKVLSEKGHESKQDNILETRAFSRDLCFPGEDSERGSLGWFNWIVFKSMDVDYRMMASWLLEQLYSSFYSDYYEPLLEFLHSTCEKESKPFMADDGFIEIKDIKKLFESILPEEKVEACCNLLFDIFQREDGSNLGMYEDAPAYIGTAGYIVSELPVSVQEHMISRGFSLNDILLTWSDGKFEHTEEELMDNFDFFCSLKTNLYVYEHQSKKLTQIERVEGLSWIPSRTNASYWVADRQTHMGSVVLKLLKQYSEEKGVDLEGSWFNDPVLEFGESAYMAEWPYEITYEKGGVPILALAHRLNAHSFDSVQLDTDIEDHDSFEQETQIGATGIIMALSYEKAGNLEYFMSIEPTILFPERTESEKEKERNRYNFSKSLVSEIATQESSFDCPSIVLGCDPYNYTCEEYKA